jgi:hypothetical protein
MMPIVRTEIVENGPLEFRVSAFYEDQGGTSANVIADSDWIKIITDDYEGCAMLHIEALPLLIESLSKIQHRLGLTHRG